MRTSFSKCQYLMPLSDKQPHRFAELELTDNVVELPFKLRINVHIAMCDFYRVNHRGMALQAEKARNVGAFRPIQPRHRREHLLLLDDVALPASGEPEGVVAQPDHYIVKHIHIICPHGA